MAESMENNVVTHGFGRRSSWQGRSGQSYGMVSEHLDHFALGDTDLFLLAKGNNVLWVGSSEELVADPMSRTRFRLALDCADRVFRVIADPTAQRMATIWDLEGGEPMQGAQAA